MFPAFAKSKIFSISPNILIIDKSNKKHMFDLILGIETLAKFGTVLDFQEHTVQIDHAVVPMRPYTSLAQKYNMRVKAFQTEHTYVPSTTGTFARDDPEPIRSDIYQSHVHKRSTLLATSP